ncbi:MAG: zinc ribbon domain-containing protein [Planctomycetes bacterium]|jgi:ribosomal protein L40E|nr:zinc ribbon domain-containing protein [Planctomycetota bacterium]
MREQQIDPGHKAARNTLRIAGPIIALAGLGFMIVGLADFFRAFGGRGEPTLFWCLFVGMPLLFVGGTLSSYGYLGRVMRYMAQETAPVGKDTFNYMAHGTQEGVRMVAGALGQGLREGGLGGGSATLVRCHKCNALAPAEAQFCGQCGQPLGKTKPCPQCRERNDPDAQFCDNCGHTFGL